MIILNPENIQKYCRNCVLFDIETTGLSSDTDQIIEISALKVVNGEVKDEFSTLVDPGVHIPSMASQINGITDDMVCGCPDVGQALKEFKAFVGNDVLAGHNIERFDLKFIQRDARRFLGREITNEHIDTLVIARRYLPRLSSRSLQSLSYHYGISYEGAHRALADCRINLEVFEHLADEACNRCNAGN